MIDRRAFLKSGSLALFTAGAGPSFLARAAAAVGEPGAYRRRKVLVTIFQRGAMDALAAVPPLDDAELRRLRPRLHMSAARAAGEGAVLDLGVGFGLHPALGELLPLWHDRSLAVVHAVGSPDPTRSHFDAQDYMETGTPGRRGTPDGWLNRVAGHLGHAATPLRSVSMTSALPRSLYGEHPALSVTDLRSLKIDRPAAGARYPRSPLGDSLRQIAFLIKSDVGLEVAFAESGGWDTHVQQGAATGSFARRAEDLARSIAAFWQDLETCRDDVVLMTMTELGRTVAENGSGGTDHGHGSCLFVLGSGVDGGKVHGRFPGLDRDALYEGRDLPVTTDFRAVFSEVAGRHLGLPPETELFPGWSGKRMPLIRRV